MHRLGYTFKQLYHALHSCCDCRRVRHVVQHAHTHLHVGVQVQLWMPTAEGGQALQTFKLYCQVERGLKGGAGLTMLSGIKLHNSCGLCLSIGMQQRWPGSSSDSDAWTTCFVAPGSFVWLPALCCNATYFSLQPAGQ